MLPNSRFLLGSRPARLFLSGGLLLAVMVAVGCGGQVIQTERLLAAAGFQMRLADSPERQAHLATMMQRQLVPEMHDGSLRYIYADAKYCKCVYVGTEKAYQRYERYALKQRVSDQRLAAAQMNEDASMNWGMWGPWGPWY